MSYQTPSIAHRHPYPVQPLQRFPRYVRIVEFLFWGGIFAVMWRTDSMFRPFVAGVCISWLVWYLIYTQFRCPACRRRMTSRTEMDDCDNTHLFYDCDQCQITYNPQFAEGPDTDRSEFGPGDM